MSIAALGGCTFIERSDVPAPGAPARAAGQAFPGDLSRDGRYETFMTEAPLVGSYTNDDVDVYVRDHATDTTERISVAVDERNVRVTVQVAPDAATGKRTALLQNQGTGAGPRSGGLTVLVDALEVT